MLLLCWNHPRKRQNTKIEYRSLLVLFMFNCEVLSFVKRFNTVDLLNRRNSIFFHNHRTKAKFNLILTALLSFFLLSSRFSLVSVVAMCYCQSINKGNGDYISDWYVKKNLWFTWFIYKIYLFCERVVELSIGARVWHKSKILHIAL